MKMLDVYTMRSMLLEYLEDTRYKLSNNGHLEVNDIHFGSDTDEHDHIYTEYGYYNEAIQNVPDTEETLITPGIFAYDGADIINNPDYECYNAQVALEFLAFEKQRSAMRLLLESYVNDIKGKVVTLYYYNDTWYYGEDVSDDVKNNSTHITAYISTEMPVLNNTISQSGYDRFQAYVNIDITILGNLLMPTDTSVSIDGENIIVSDMEISRIKTKKAYNVKSLEIKSYAEDQTISITIAGLLRSNDAFSTKLKSAILDSDKLNTSFVISYDGHTYTMFLDSGTLKLAYGSTISYQASFSLLKEGI